MEDDKMFDQPAVVERVAPPPDKPAMDMTSKPREAFSLAVRPRLRCTGTDRYRSYSVAASELIKIAYPLRSEAVPDPGTGGDSAEVEMLQAWWDQVDFGFVQDGGDNSPFISSKVQIQGIESTAGTGEFNSATISPGTIMTAPYSSVLNAGTNGLLDDGWWSGRVIIAQQNHFCQEHTYSFEVNGGAIRFGEVYITPPIINRAQEPLQQTDFGVKVLTAVNTANYSTPKPTEKKELRVAPSFALDLHDLLENNTELFPLFEAYRIKNMTLQFTDIGNFLKSSAQCFAAYVDDPERQEAMGVEAVQRVSRYDPRQANLKFFTAGHNCTFDIPVHDSVYFTLRGPDSDKRFVSPGVFHFGVINLPGDVFNYTVTIMMEVAYYVQTMRSTNPAIGRTVTVPFPNATTMEFKAPDKFLAVYAEFLWDVPDGTYFPLAHGEYSVELPDTTKLISSLPSISVSDGIGNFKVNGLEDFDYNFVDTQTLPVVVNSNSDHYYYVPK